MLFKLIFWYGRYSVIHIFHIYIYTFDIIRCPSTTSIALPIHRILIWESKFDDKCCEFFRLINPASWQSPVWPARPVPALNIWVVLLTAGMPGGREGGESVWWGLSPVWALSYFTTLSTLNTKTYPADSAVIITIVGCSLYVVQYAGLHYSLYLIYNKQTIKQTQLCQSVLSCPISAVCSVP